MCLIYALMVTAHMLVQQRASWQELKKQELVSFNPITRKKVREPNKGVDETRAAAEKELSIQEVSFLLQSRIQGLL